MKCKLAAITTAFLILSACSAKSSTLMPNTAQEDAPVLSSQEEALPSEPEASSAPDMQIETKPAEPEIHFAESFTDEPYEVQTDMEEIVSLSLTLPYITLDTSEDAMDQINSAFVTLKDNLNQFASTTVYETAQSRNTIGFVEGSYTVSLSDGVLTVTYTVEERYADSDDVTTYENVYRFDTATGERLDA